MSRSCHLFCSRTNKVTQLYQATTLFRNMLKYVGYLIICINKNLHILALCLLRSILYLVEKIINQKMGPIMTLSFYCSLVVVFFLVGFKFSWLVFSLNSLSIQRLQPVRLLIGHLENKNFTSDDKLNLARFTGKCDQGVAFNFLSEVRFLFSRWSKT